MALPFQSFRPWKRFSPTTGTALLVSFLLASPLHGADAEWNTDASGDWTTGGNWNPASAPGGAGDIATFGNIITSNRIVNLDANTTVGGLVFDDNNNYTLSGSKTLTFNNSGSAATINVSNTNGNGAHTINFSNYPGITLNDDLEITQNSSGEFQISAAINGAGGITKKGEYKLSLNGTSTFLGDVAVENGFLQVSDIASDGDSNLGAATTAVGIGSATTYGTLYYNGADGVSFTRGLNVKAGGGQFYTSRDVTFATNGIAISSGGTLDIETFDSSDDLIFNNVISGDGDITFSGNGHYKLNGSNTYTGGTTLTNGTLYLGDDDALGTGDLTVDGGTIIFTNATRTIANDINVTSDLSFNINPYDGSPDQNGVLTGTISFTPDGSTHTIYNYNYLKSITLSQGLSGNYGLEVVSSSSGSNNLYLNGNNNFTGGLTLSLGTFGGVTLNSANTDFGDITINSGTLYTNIANALPSDTDVNISSGVNGATLDLNDTSQTIDALDGTSTSEVTLGAAVSNTFTVGNDNGSGTFSGVISEKGHLVKSGSGTQVLDGTSANTYNGNTTINDGVLALDKTAGTNAIAGGDITINTGGELELRDSNQLADTSNMILAGGTFDTGGFSESLANLTLSDNSIIDLGAGTSKLTFDAVNTWDEDMTLVIKNWSGILGDADASTGDDYIRFDADPSLSATALSNITFEGFAGVADIYDNSDGYYYLRVTPVIPEPSTYLSVSALLGLACLHYRRKHRTSERIHSEA